MTDCDHDLIISRCSKCGQSAKVILLNTFIEGFIEDCESSCIQIGTTWYVQMEKIRRLRRRLE
jgi:hypothetical protein